MLLSDEEIHEIAYGSKEHIDFARAIEAALLAKLQAMEMPEPYCVRDPEGSFMRTDRARFLGYFVDQMECFYTAAQLQQAHAQGYAKGAAEQLAEVPIAFCELSIGGKSIAHFDGKPMFMAGKVGNAMHQTPLYTRKEAK